MCLRFVVPTINWESDWELGMFQANADIKQVPATSALILVLF
jgi:hypothetical protein